MAKLIIKNNQQEEFVLEQQDSAGARTIQGTDISLKSEISSGAYVNGINIYNGLNTSLGTDVLHDVDIDPGQIMDSTGTVVMVLPTTLTKQIDAVWAEGTNLGGFPSTLTLTADTTYHLFLIAKVDGTVDAGWDTDINATNLLADAVGYTYFRRIFSHITDGTPSLINYVQYGDYVYWLDTTLDYSSTSTGTNRVVVPVRVPTGLELIAITNCEMQNSGGETVNAWFRSTSYIDVAATSTNRTHYASPSTAGGSQQQMQILTDNLGQIAFRASLSSATNLINIRTSGYIDKLGKM